MLSSRKRESFMVYYVAGLPYSSELYHHGIKNQKWGVRRFQYEDGSLTPAGRDHYGYESERKFKVAKAAENSSIRSSNSSNIKNVPSSKKGTAPTSSSVSKAKGTGTSAKSTKESDDKDGTISKINSMRSKLKDKETGKELDYIIGKLKSGAYSSEDALAAAKDAVDMDTERSKYLASQKNKKTKKSSKGSSKKDSKTEKELKKLKSEAKEAKEETQKISEELNSISGMFEPETLSAITKALTTMKTTGDLSIDEKTVKTIEDYVVKVSGNTALKDLLKKINEKKTEYSTKT